jgi:hypothetical protein
MWPVVHAICTVFSVFLTMISGAHANNCVRGDPWLELGGAPGDFELTADPQDPKGRLIFASNMITGARTTDVVIARLDELTSQVLLGSRSVIAKNFNDEPVPDGNGPDFVQQPTGELGVVYAGSRGVHGIFRSAAPLRWRDFSFDVNGTSIQGDPPPLPGTSIGEFPKSGMLPGQRTYGKKKGDNCVEPGACYAALDIGIATDVFAVAADHGYRATAAAQSPRDGHVYVAACESDTSCGLFEAQIDHAGGFVPGTLQRLASLEQPLRWESLRAARHPVTGSTVIFTGEEIAGEGAVNVWEQSSNGGVLTLLGKVPGNPGTSGPHYRAETSATEVVLHYFVEGAFNQGSYTIPVSAIGSRLVIGSRKKISDISDSSELIWAPAAKRWALFYRTALGTLNRCWVTP